MIVENHPVHHSLFGLLSGGELVPMHAGSFQSAPEALGPSYEGRLRELGVEIKAPRPRVEGEGLSLYFYGYDNNLFELHAGTLEQRLARYAQ